MVTDGQLISLKSHTIGSIGQIIKNDKYSDKEALDEIRRVYKGYISKVSSYE